MPDAIVRLADAFLSRITDDTTGIWELADEARHRMPDIPAERRLTLAQSALDLLLTMRFVVATRGAPFASGDPLDAEEAVAAIGSAAIWASPTASGEAI